MQQETADGHHIDAGGAVSALVDQELAEAVMVLVKRRLASTDFRQTLEHGELIARTELHQVTHQEETHSRNYLRRSQVE